MTGSESRRETEGKRNGGKNGSRNESGSGRENLKLHNQNHMVKLQRA